MGERSIDDWLRVMADDLHKMAYNWAEELGEALNGGSAGELDVVIEQLKANTVFEETTSENAAEQIARLTKWRVRILKTGRATTGLVTHLIAIAQALETLTLIIAEEKFEEAFVLDWTRSSAESMANDRFRPGGADPDSGPDGPDGRRPRFQ